MKNYLYRIAIFMQSGFFLKKICQATVYSGDGLDVSDLKNEIEGVSRETDLKDSILAWVNFVLGFVALVLFISIIYSGFIYLTTFGDDSRTATAKKSILYSVVGIIIIVSSYAIVNTIFPGTT